MKWVRWNTPSLVVLLALAAPAAQSLEEGLHYFAVETDEDRDQGIIRSSAASPPGRTRSSS